MKASDFLIQYSVRVPNIMWFLGAGTSAAAGVPTAYNMIWDFKRTLYCAAQKVSVRSCPDLGNAALRIKLQLYFDTIGGFPPENSDEEYARYFEATFPSESDRRRYIERMMSGANPSYGHRALAALLKLDKARIVWTTNFDPMVEDATVTLFGSSGRLVSSTLDTSQLAMQAINEGRWPLLAKIHSDFRSRRLKNTSEELRAQDAELRHALVEACKRFGLAIIGYSGRDHSVMNALEEAIDGGRGYPFGLFWFQRADSPCMPRVSDLITKAAAAGVEAHLVNVETFDELMADVLLLIPEVPAEIQEHLNKEFRRVSDAPMPETRGTWPVIRLNALPVVSYPTVCRRVACKIGGTREVRDAVKKVGAQVLAVRRQIGVIAFGSDGEVRKAFDPHRITEFDVHSIEPQRLRFESAELGLLYEALCHALARERPVKIVRVRSSYMLAVDQARADELLFQPLQKVAQKIAGKVPRTEMKWAEAMWIRLEHRLGRLWLIMEPTIWVERTDDDDLFHLTREFIRARLAGRYNSAWNVIIEAWTHIITNGTEKSEIKTFGIGDGIDAVFTISSVTAFSRREVKR